MRTRPWLLVLTAAAMAALALPGSAGADFQALYDDYKEDGAIDACMYSASELSAGLSEIPADVREYDPGFSEAINAALEQRAAGCKTRSQAPAGGTAAIQADDGSPGPPSPRPERFPAGEEGTPGVLWALIAMIAGGLATATLLTAARYFGWDLEARLAPLGNAARSIRDRIADRLWALRNRLGF